MAATDMAATHRAMVNDIVAERRIAKARSVANANGTRTIGRGGADHATSATGQQGADFVSAATGMGSAG